MQKKRKRNTAGLGILVAVLIICELASMIVLCSRVIGYTEAKFVNVLSLTEETVMVSETDGTAAATEQADAISAGETAAPSEATTAPGGQTVNGKHPEFRMEAEAEIFRFSYDNESGKTTVIGPAGNTDKLIAPGTTNLYQFTLRNPGDVALDYTLTMEAYVTGTDLWIPVNARLWDYTNKYLVGSADGMVDVMELNTVNESAELGAGRYAVYNLEWEWPFEWGDDEYDTMLGNLAVDEDLVLHIVIRTVAECDETPENPDVGLPATGDTTNLWIYILLFVVAFAGLCATFLAGRKRKQEEEA